MVEVSEPKLIQNCVLSAHTFCCEHIFALCFLCLTAVRNKLYYDIEIIIIGSFDQEIFDMLLVYILL